MPVATTRLQAQLEFLRLDWLLIRECLDALRQIDLRWHDLRHEYASRLAERGVPLSQIRDLLGHASIVTTERYDTQRPEALIAVAKLLEPVAEVSTKTDTVAAARTDARDDADAKSVG